MAKTATARRSGARRRPARDAHRPSAAAGFGLLEVLISAGLIIGLAAGTAQLTVRSIDAIDAAGELTQGTLLAVQKMEQLQSLEWRYDGSGLVTVSDATTDLSGELPSAGGPGLRVSPPDSLERSVPGYVDYLDGRGGWVGTGSRPRTGTRFVRRWSVQAGQPPFDDLLALAVVVLPLRLAESAGAADVAPNQPGLVRLGALKRRR